VLPRLRRVEILLLCEKVNKEKEGEKISISREGRGELEEEE